MCIGVVAMKLLPSALALALTVWASSTGLNAADVARSRADADQLLRKLAVIATHGMSAQPAARRTTVTESEVNSFLEFHARDEMPPGVIDPIVAIEEGGRLRGRAIVDLDEVKKAGEAEGQLGALAMLSGRVPVEASGTLRAANGVAQFQLEQASINGVPVPKALVREVVTYYSRTAEYPEGIDFEAPFTLPVHIRSIETARGQAVVVQ
jgi:hypothetical protein